MSGEGTSADEHLVNDWRRIRAGAAMVQRRLDAAVEAEGVPAQWFAVLQMLLVGPTQGLPMTVLARDLDMTSGGFTKLVDRMAKDGLVDRRGVAGDRRVVHAALTERGREAAGRAEQVYLAALGEALAPVGRTELDAAGRTMATLAREGGSGTPPEDPALLATQRDPALPDRRGRGRAGS